MRKGYKRWMAIVMLVSVLVLQVGCGQEEPPYHVGGSSSGNTQTEQSTGTGVESENSTPGDSTGELQVLEEMPDDVYQAKEMMIAAKWDVLMNGKVYGDSFHYKQYGGGMISNAFSGGNERKCGFKWEEEPSWWSVSLYCYDPVGNFYAYAQVGEEGYKLLKFDSELNWQYMESLGEFGDRMGDDDMISFSWEMVADAEGRVYLSTDTSIGLYDEKGIYQGEVTFDSAGISILDLLTTADGKVYLLYAKGSPSYSYISEINFEEKSVTNLAKTRGLEGLTEDLERKLYAFNSDKMYSLDLEAGQMTPLFTWTDCGIIGLEVCEVSPTDDGRWAVLNGSMSPLSGRVTLLKRLTKEEAAALPEKQEIVIGTMGDVKTALSQAVMRFNKESDLYKVTIHNYRSDMELDAARNKLNAELIAGKGPDIFHEFGGFGIANFVEKGLFEDLYTYLEKSEALSKEDFVDRILELYTRDGKLIGIPHEFEIYTLMGSVELLGEEPGWTLEEMFQCIEQNPDKEIFKLMTRTEFLNLCMTFNEELFIDNESGECSFNSKDFKTVLKLASKFPEGHSFTGASELTLAAQGEILLIATCINTFTDLQPHSRVLQGGFNCIGYPTPEGIGSRIISDDTLSISSLSDCKEGAWAFMEYFYQYQTPENTLNKVLPVLKREIQLIAERDMSEDGPRVGSKGSQMPDGAKYEIYPATQEEVDAVYQLMDGLRLYSSSTDVFTIIKEEAAAYFEGQKSVDAVAEIIQNRVQIYVDENR